MSVVIEGSLTENESENSYWHYPSFGSLGFEAGDLILIIFSCDGDNTVTFGDYTKIIDVNDGKDITLTVAYKIAGEGESSTVIQTSGSEKGTWIVIRITGHDSGNPPEGVDSSSGSDEYPDPISLSPTGGSKEYLWIACYAADDQYSWTSAYPTDYTYHQNTKAGNNPGGAACGIAARILTATSENPGTFTLYGGAEQWEAGTIAIYPAEVGGETVFNTIVGSPIGWSWGTATIDTDTAPRSPTTDGLGWNWEVVSNTSTNYIPSGNELSWDWCVEDAGS